MAQYKVIVCFKDNDMKKFLALYQPSRDRALRDTIISSP